MESQNMTFGELLVELKSRLGDSAPENDAALTSFLQEAHDIMWCQLNPVRIRKRVTFVLETAKDSVFMHNDIECEDIDSALVQAVWLLDGTDKILLEKGIANEWRNEIGHDKPTRYDTLDGHVEVYPSPDKSYGLLIEYISPRPRFTQPQDRPGVSDRLVLLYALALVKSHFRLPDAQVAVSACTSLLRLEKIRKHQLQRVLP